MIDADSLRATCCALNIEPARFRKLYAMGLRAPDAFIVALHLARLGFWVFPATMQKTPLCLWKEEATNHPRKIIQLQRRALLMLGDDVTWCIRTGREFGLWGLDEDGPGGRARRIQLEGQYGPLSSAVMVTTGRRDGGVHYWHAPTPSGPDLKTVVRANIGGIRAPIDQKGAGGYMVVPGSRHKSGKRYAFVDATPDEVALAGFSSAWLPILDYADERHLPSPNKNFSRSGNSSRVKREHDASSYLIGDGEGFGGFQDPIYKNAIQYFFLAGTDAPADIIITTLRELIVDAPKDPARDVSRYLSGPDLPRIVERARRFVKEVDCDGYECEPESREADCG